MIFTKVIQFQTKIAVIISNLILMMLVSLFIIFSTAINAQVDFTGTTSIDFAGYAGEGLTPSPNADQLDSDEWEIGGLSDGNTTYGGSFTTGDFAKGDTDGTGQGGGGLFGLVTPSNNAFWISPTGADMTPGTVTLRLQNNTSADIDVFDVAYDLLYLNDQPRAVANNFKYSTDNTTYIPVSTLDFTTPLTADALGMQTINQSIRLTLPSAIAQGAYFYLRWTTDDAGGSGARDEVGMDNISVACTKVTNINTGEKFCSIQDAIDDANTMDGHTLVVVDGTFSENLTINKNVKLEGNNEGIAGTDVRNAETILENCNINVTASGAVTIDGFKILRTAAIDGDVMLLGGSSDATVQNCIFERNGSAAGTNVRALVTASGTGTKTITDNLFTGDDSGGLFSGHLSWNSAMYINGAASTVNIIGNVIENSRTAINIDDYQSDIMISDNTIDNNGTHLSFGGTTPTDGQFSLGINDFINNPASTMINLSDVTETFRLDITSSTINGAAFNTLTNAQLFEVEARMAHKEVSASKKGKVIYVANTQYVNNFSSPITKIDQINNSIKYADAGDVINLQAGQYDQRVVIDKSDISLQGLTTDKSLYIIDGTAQATGGSGVYIMSNATDVTIKDLTIQNFSGTNGNTHAGIYANGQNDGLNVDNVAILDNVGGSGFYANGPVDYVTINNCMISGHTLSARGIVIWNGLKSNITITNNTVSNNNCCGIELQDGSATGINISDNIVFENGDNGIGVIGLTSGAGENYIANNLLQDNGRFGIEIKNPLGTGATSGDGAIIVEDNDVEYTAAFTLTDVRDCAGIAVFRRAPEFSAGNPDIPQGVIIRDNSITGYKQSSDSDGFGIVVEGQNHTIENNTIERNDVGLQIQAGHLPYTGAGGVADQGDQSNLNDDYFGRGNASHSCNIVDNGQAFGSGTFANGVDFRTVGFTDYALEGTRNIQNQAGNIFCSIQQAIDATSTITGDQITVPAGTYFENVVVDKEVALLGSNSGISPNTGTRVAESIIVPNTSSSDAIILIQADDVSIDGFTIDGDNTFVTTGWAGTNGADIDAYDGIAAYDPSNVISTSNMKVENNIIQNLSYFGVDNFGWYNYNNPPTSSHLVKDNLFQDLGHYNVGNGYDFWGGGVILYNDNYTRIVDNVMTNVRIGIQTGNFHDANPGDSQFQEITNNTIQARRRGIFYNLHTGANVSPWTVSNNTITALDDTNESVWDGILASSLSHAVGIIKDNTIDGSGTTKPSEGFEAWNVNPNAPVRFEGGSASNVDIGVFVNNYEGYSSDAGDTEAQIVGVDLTNNVGTGIYIKDSPSNTNNAMVAAEVLNDTDVSTNTTDGTGILVEGADASAIIHGNLASITSNNIGILVDAGTATIDTNNISNNNTGIKFQNGATGTAHINNITNNSNFGVENTTGTAIDATSNWWGDASGPSGEGGGTGDVISVDVLYCPWLGGMSPNGTVASEVENITSNTVWCSIQEAIDNATAGDTIEIQPTDYTEPGQIVVDKNLTIQGKGKTMTTLRPGINTGTSGDARGFILVNPTVEFNLLDMTIDGTGKLVWQAVRQKGSGTIDEVAFTEIKYNESGPQYAGTAVAAFGDGNVDISNSMFTEIGRVGVLYFGTGINGASFDNNMYTGKGVGDHLDYMLDISAGAIVNVTNNEVSQNYGVASSDGSTSAGILVTTFFAGGTQATITNNSLHDNTTGIAVGFDGSDASVVIANENDIYDNDNGITSTGPVVDAENNYWGAADGPGGVGSGTGNSISSNVMACPFYDAPVATGTLVNCPVIVYEGATSNVRTSHFTIQEAIDETSTIDGDRIEISSGIYDEQVVVNKPNLTLLGVGTPKPTINFTGTVSGKTTLVDVQSDGAVIDNIIFEVDLTTLHSAVIASATDLDNITIKNNEVNPYQSTIGTHLAGYGDRNAFSINYGGSTNYRVASGGVDNIIVTNNIVTVGKIGADYFDDDAMFRAAVAVDEGAGTYTGNDFSSINHDIINRFNSNGPILIDNNTFRGGGVEAVEFNAGGGTVTISNNMFDTDFGIGYTSLLRLKNNQQDKTTIVSGNTFNNHSWAISLENFSDVTIDNNSFTPTDLTDYRHITVNTKSNSSNSANIVQDEINGVIINNIFNPSATSTAGIGIAFYNHDSDNADIGSFIVGNNGNENVFNLGIPTFIKIDDREGITDGVFPEYSTGGTWTTEMDCWIGDIDVRDNQFDLGSGALLVSAMSMSEIDDLEDNYLYDRLDSSNGCSADLITATPVYNMTQNTYHNTIQNAIDNSAGSSGSPDVIIVDAGIYYENIVVTKDYIDLRGNNYGIDACQGSRNAESIIIPLISGPDPFASAPDPEGQVIMYLDGSRTEISIDGFTFEGDNPNITSGTVLGGVDIDAFSAIAGYYGVDQTTVSNNIVQNVSYSAIEFASFGNAFATSAEVNNNKIQNVQLSPYGIAVLQHYNAYISATSNCLIDVNTGFQTGNLNIAHPLSIDVEISQNDIQSNNVGIWHNVSSGSCPKYLIENNTVDCDDTAIKITSLSGVEIETKTNTIAGGENGIEIWNCKDDVLITLSQDDITGAETGIFVNNYEGYNSDASRETNVIVEGAVIKNSVDYGIRILDSDLSTNHTPLSATIKGNTDISDDDASSHGIAVEGEFASATVEDNYVSITDNDIGILVDAGSATITGNKISDNNIGVKFENAGSGTVVNNDITNNTTFGVQNMTGTVIDATLNWWGDNSGPSGEGPGTGDGVSEEVIFCPWLDNSILLSGASTSPIVNFTQSTNHCTIQEAVDAAVYGDVIAVPKGNWYEDVTIATGITIQGPNVSNSACSGSRVSEAIIYGVIDVAAADVTLSGFKIVDGGIIAGSKAAVYVRHSLTGVSIENNIIVQEATQSGYFGILNEITNPSEITINGNSISNWNIAVYLQNTEAEVYENCLFDNTYAGVGLDMKGNELSIYNNDIYNNPLGIEAFDDLTLTSINYNNFDNILDVQNNSTTTNLDATLNYWGQATEPVVNTDYEENTSTVFYCPWLLEEPDTANPTNADNNAVAENIDSGGLYCSIQQAIDEATAGNTIVVEPGIYNENVILNKAIELRGANANVECDSRTAESKISVNSGTPVTISAVGATINGFQIEAPNSTNAINLSNASNTKVIYNSIINTGINLTGGNVHAIVYQLDGGAYMNVDINDNCIDGVASSALSGSSASAIAILQSTSTGTLTNIKIQRNKIDNVDVNTGTWPTGKIAYGILINAGSSGNGSVVDGVINQNEINNLSGHIATGIGLEGNTGNAFVTNNYVANLSGTKSADLAGGGYDVNGLKFESNSFASTVTVEGNSFDTPTFSSNGTSGLGYAVANYETSGAVTLGCNWYGSAIYNEIEPNDIDGLILEKSGATTSFIPYLVDGTDDNNALIGFQPTTSCSGTPVVIDDIIVTSIECDASLTSGEIEIQFSGGDSDYTIDWGVGNISGIIASPYTITGLVAGTYDINITDTNGSFVTQTTTVQFTPHEVIIDCPDNITLVNDQNECSAIATFELPNAYELKFYDGFENSTMINWLDYSANVSIVPTGNGGISSSEGSSHAEIDNSSNTGSLTGAFTRLGGYNSSFGNGFKTSVDVYIDLSDPAITADTYGWDLSSAVSDQTGGHQRDFIFHAASNATGNVLIAGSNNTNFTRRNDLATLNHYEITTTGWYTFEFDFKDAGDGSLAVDLNLIDDAGDILFTETRNSSLDIIATEIGGNRYMWFTFVATDILRIDNTRRYSTLLTTADFASGTAFPVGSTTVTITSATDMCGDTHNCTFDVIVNDTEAPAVVCQDVTIQLDGNGEGTLLATDIDDGSTDNCGSISFGVLGNPEGLTFDQNVTSEVIFGTGNGNGAFTTSSVNDVELGLRAKVRFPSPTGTYNSNGDGSYDHVTGSFGGDGMQSGWNFEWSINTNATGSGTNLDQLTYELGLDFDPTDEVDYLVFDPINLPFADHAIGNNSTGNGAGTVASDAASYAALISNNNLAQNSWRHNFFGAFDGTIDGRYDVYLKAYDTAGNEVAATAITVIVGTGTGNPYAGSIIPLELKDYDCSNVGTISETLIGIDAGGNSSTCTANVTIIDIESPTVVCQDVTIQLDGNGEGTLLASDIDDGSADNCGPIRIGVLGNPEGLTYDQNVTSNVIFGTGNGNGAFTTSSANEVELGLRAKVRFPTPTGTYNSNGDGSYDHAVGSFGGDGFQSGWNFEWSINTNATGSGTNLDQLTYELGLDFDPTDAVDYVVFDPINLPYADHAIGNNNTGNGGGAVAVDASDYATLISSNNLAQNSWRHNFFGAFDGTVDGRYDVYLKAYDASGNEVAATAITVSVGSGTGNPYAGSLMPLESKDYDCSNVGVITETLISIDENGNTSTCTADVTIVDIEAPTVICQDVTVQLDENGETTLVVNSIDNGSTDNCEIAGIGILGSPEGLMYDQNVTSDVIFGSGNGNGSFTTSSDNDVELGLRAKVRFPTPTGTYNSNGDGSYDHAAGSFGGDGFQSGWNFEWSINTNATGSGTNLDQLTYELGLDFDPSDAVDYIVFDPINLPYADHAIGNNSTGNGGGTVASDATDYASLIANNNLAQNSWRHNFFGAFDGNVDGRYDVYLKAFDASGNEVAATAITTIVGNGTGNAYAGTIMPLGSKDYDCGEIGTVAETLLVIDSYGNSSTCTSVVTIEDNVAPEFVNCPVDDETCTADLPYTWTHPELSDNCSSGTGTLLSYQLSGATTSGSIAVTSFDGSTTASETLNPGVTIITYTANDNEGNPTSNTCSFEVTTYENPVPEIDAEYAVWFDSNDNIASTSVAGDSYLWTITNGNILTDPTLDEITYEPTSNNPITLELIITENGCSAMTSETVMVLGPCEVLDFSMPIIHEDYLGAGVWQTDRYEPSLFEAMATAPDATVNTLKHSISIADGANNRPGGFSGGFYNTQGKKTELYPGTVLIEAQLYLPADWETSGRRMAGIWGTAYNASDAISAYPIIEFTSDNSDARFRGYEGDGSWLDIALPSSFVYDNWVTLRIELLSNSEFRYIVETDQGIVTATSALHGVYGSVRIDNMILQGHNTTDGVDYDIYWNGVLSTPIDLNVELNTTTLTNHDTFNICEGDVLDINLTSSAGGTYELFKDGNSLQTGPLDDTYSFPSFISLSDEGDYLVEVVGAEGCTTEFNFYVDVKATPELSVDVNGITANSSSDPMLEICDESSVSTTNLIYGIPDGEALFNVNFDYNNIDPASFAPAGDNELTGAELRAAFEGSSIPISLTDKLNSGSLVITVTPYNDLNENGILDVGTDCNGDDVVITITVDPAPEIMFTVLGENAQSNNNGVTDATEYLELTLCDYIDTDNISYSSIVSNMTGDVGIMVSYSGSNILNVSSTPTEITDQLADINAMLGSMGNIQLDDETQTGLFVISFTPFNDLNNDGIQDAGECVGESITLDMIIYPVPEISLEIEGITALSDNTGIEEDVSDANQPTIVDENIEITVCDYVDMDNLIYTGISSAMNGNTGLEVIISSNNIFNVPSSPLIGSLAGINTMLGAMGNIQLDDANMFGNLELVIYPFNDLNGNDQKDSDECTGDPITIIINVEPNPTMNVEYDFNNSGSTTPILNGDNVVLCSMDELLDINVSSTTVLSDNNLLKYQKVITTNGVTVTPAVATGTTDDLALTSSWSSIFDDATWEDLQSDDAVITVSLVPYVELDGNTSLSTEDCNNQTITFTITIHPEPVSEDATENACTESEFELILHDYITNDNVGDDPSDDDLEDVTFSWSVNSINPPLQLVGVSPTDDSNNPGTHVLNGYSFTNNITNPYTVPVTVQYEFVPTSVNGCEGEPFLVDVIINQVVTASTNPNGSLDLCEGESRTLLGFVTPTGSYSYNWEIIEDAAVDEVNNPSTLINATSQSPVLQVSDEINITKQIKVGFTATNNSTGCIDYDTLIFNVFHLPVADVISLSTCELTQGNLAGNFNLNDAVSNVLPATSVVTFHTSESDAEGDVGAILNTSSYTATDGQQIYVRVENGGCALIETIVMNVSGTPLFTNTVDNVSCFGTDDGSIEVVTTFGSSPFSYSNDNGTSFQSSPLFNNLTPGIYSIVIMDGNGCTSDAIEVEITQPDVLMATGIDGETSCNGGSDAVVSVDVEGGTTNYTYMWNDPNNSTTASVTGLVAGTYNVTVEDANGCTAEASATVIEPDALSLTTTGSDLDCNGDMDGSVSVSASGGTSGYSYSWNDPNSSTTFSVSGLGAGIYEVTVTDANGCMSTASAEVTTPQELTASTVDDELSCNGDMDGEVSVIPSGGTMGYSYEWNDTNGSTTPTVSGLGAGIYEVTVTDAKGCSTTAIATITQPDALVATGVDGSVSCSADMNGTVSVNVSGGTMNYTYLWDDTNASTGPSVSGLGAGTYNVLVTDAKGCTAVASVIVTVDNALMVMNANDSGPGSLRDVIANICPNQDVTFDSSLSGQTITLQSEIQIIGNTVIAGLGMNNIFISGNNLNRIFNVNSGTDLVIEDLTLQDCDLLTDGGAILNEGNLSLENVKLSNNKESGIPKALTNKGNLIIKSNVVLED